MIFFVLLLFLVYCIIKCIDLNFNLILIFLQSHFKEPLVDYNRQLTQDFD